MSHPEFDPGPLSPVDCRAEGNGRWTLVFTRDLHHPRPKVWAALTEPGQLEQWAPYTADRNLGEPGRATLTMIDGLSTTDLASSVQRAEPPRLLEYTWGPNDSLRWELQETEFGTRLILSHTVLDRAMVAKVAAGWHLCLLVADRLLGNSPVGPIRGNDALEYGWQELHDAYAQKLTPEDQ